MPNALHQDFDRLRQVARLYNDGLFNSKHRLQAAQWQFDLKRKTLNHEVKVFNANAAKHPHAPVVKAVKQTGNKSASLMDSMWGVCIVCMVLPELLRCRNSRYEHEVRSRVAA